MGYYLSKDNEAFLLSFLPLLKAAKSTIKLETSDPNFLIYVLRNAWATDKYSWLRDKFVFASGIINKDNVLVPVVVCKIRNPIVSINDSILCINDRYELIDIINYIIQEKPDIVRFTNVYLTDSEYERLQVYCKQSNYTVTKDDKGVTIING